jgi:small-conductance mechanosensitive channel
MTTWTAPPPLALRAAVGVWLALAVFGLFNVVFLWLNQDKVREALRPDVTVSDVLVPLTVAAVLFAAAYGLFTWLLLRRGKRRARIGLSATAFLHLIWVVLPGVSLANLITVVLLGVGLVLTWRRSAAHWLREQQ